MTHTYTVVTFSPVQGFIETSRKLRDLYGSSYLLSYLAYSLYKAAQDHGCTVTSPASVNVAKGIPNTLLIQGDFPQNKAQDTLRQTWRNVIEECRHYLETQVPSLRPSQRTWAGQWSAWANYTWEFFWAQGHDSGDAKIAIKNAFTALNRAKQQRDWTGINWMGESSTLSGTDAIAWPQMDSGQSAKDFLRAETYRAMEEYCTQLSKALPDSIVDSKEQLSIPELTKRLITLYDVTKNLPNLKVTELPRKFTDLNRKDSNTWTGWFMGDGDSMGKYLDALEPEKRSELSEALIKWGADLENHLPKAFNPTDDDHDKAGRIIYSGGDDFLGVLYRKTGNKPLSLGDCLDSWFSDFKTKIWANHGQGITVSVGLVWAGPQVPLRDVLQHSREAEKAAKNAGRDRLALRILFNSGQHLQWVCPWDCLKAILGGYCDRSGKTGQDGDWKQFHSDYNHLHSRHAIPLSPIDANPNLSPDDLTQVSQALLKFYFPKLVLDFSDNSRFLFNLNPEEAQKLGPAEPRSGILGPREAYLDQAAIAYAFNRWVHNLAQIAPYLYAAAK